MVTFDPRFLRFPTAPPIPVAPPGVIPNVLIEDGGGGGGPPPPPRGREPPPPGDRRGGTFPKPPPPGPPPPPAGGGVPPGPPPAGGDVTVEWLDTYNVDEGELKFFGQGVPSWWQGFTPSVWNEETEYIALMNSLIPFLSPEDQNYAASVLSRYDPETFGGYGEDGIEPPDDLDLQTRDFFRSAWRGREIIDTLNRVAEASGRDPAEFGAGYQFLLELADVLDEFGGGGAPSKDGPVSVQEHQTRREKLQQLAALDPLMAELQGTELAPYGSISRMLTQPFFSAGFVTPYREIGGRIVFGQPNQRWY